MKAIDISYDPKQGLEQLDDVIHHLDQYTIVMGCADKCQHVGAMVAVRRDAASLRLLADLLTDLREMVVTDKPSSWS